MEVAKLKELKGMMKKDETIVVLDRDQADLRIDETNDNECFFQLEGVKGMNHKTNSGTNVNNVGLWKIGEKVKFKKKPRTIGLSNPFTNETVNIQKDLNATTLDPHLVRTTDTRDFTSYESGGTLVQKKVPVRTDFKDFKNASNMPNVLTVDYSKWGAAQQHHVATQAMMTWSSKYGNGELPTIDNFDEVKKCAQDVLKNIQTSCEGDAMIGGQFNEDTINDTIIKKTIMHCKSELHPLQAFFGGVAAQEVMKFTGKFLPLNQWLYLDCFELFDDELPKDGETKEESRYDHMINMFGKSFATKVQESSTYLVGCGALGCEYAKNFAMMGLATAGNGHLHITDPDNIEVSNLARQFLFRKEHAEAKANKASTAKGVIKKMNPDINVTTYEKYAAPSTEDLFDDTFYNNMSFITNALDNVQARNYVDGRCVAARKALLESGTQGTKCNSIVILPDLTQSYTDGAQISDEDGDAIPMCTLRNFPNLINHCVEWARSMFTDMFEAPFKTAKMFTMDQKALVDRYREEANTTSLKETKMKDMKQLLEILSFSKNKPTFAKCVELARDFMFRLHRDNILDLTHNFPKDAMKDGKPFWSKRRRFPQAATYNCNDELQTRYITCVANIFAVNFGIQPEPDSTSPETIVPSDHEWRKPETVQTILKSSKVREWVFSGAKTKTNDDDDDDGNESKEGTSEDEINKQFDDMLNELSTFDVKGLNFVEADFEKDLDSNFHIDFIWSATNLRAWNYQLELASRHKAKMIAGKIIPAILTATASICGLMAIEILKIIRGIDDLSKYKSSSCNLGVNAYNMMEPGAVVKHDSQEKAENDLKSAQSSYDSCMKRMKKKYDDGELKDRDLTTINNVTVRLASMESAMKSAQPCFPKGWTKWDKIIIEAESLSWVQLVEMIEKKSNYKVVGLYPTSNVCTFFDASYSKPYLEAFPKNAKFFEEGTKWYKMGKGKRKAAEQHDAIYSKAANPGDLMEEAKTMLLNDYINSDSVQETLKSVPKGKDGIKRKKQTEEDVKRAQGDIDSYNRHRWVSHY
jgi:ubiquitin-activating enzyme E1